MVVCSDGLEGGFSNARLIGPGIFRASERGLVLHSVQAHPPRLQDQSCTIRRPGTAEGQGGGAIGLEQGRVQPRMGH
eukprot:7813090-Pyramimonas_sp.AAC.1